MYRDVSILNLKYSSFYRVVSDHVMFSTVAQGWADVGFHGSVDIPTPNLDAMAYDGILLGHNYLQPICTPSRSAFMTSRHPIHLGISQTCSLCIYLFFGQAT